METQVQKFRDVYGTALRIVDGGGLFTDIYDKPASEQAQDLSVWTQTMAFPWAAEFVYFAFECHGALYGTGYSIDTSTYTIMFPTDNYDVNGVYAPFNNISQDGTGCTIEDFDGSDSKVCVPVT